MSKDTSGPAFPARVPLVFNPAQGTDYPDYSESGMSLRDWYAGQALVGLVANTQPEIKAPLLAQQAYAIADAMLREGDK
jgi:hypothetical protein